MLGSAKIHCTGVEEEKTRETFEKNASIYGVDNQCLLREKKDSSSRQNNPEYVPASADGRALLR